MKMAANENGVNCRRNEAEEKQSMAKTAAKKRRRKSALQYQLKAAMTNIMSKAKIIRES